MAWYKPRSSFVEAPGGGGEMGGGVGRADQNLETLFIRT